MSVSKTAFFKKSNLGFWLCLTPYASWFTHLVLIWPFLVVVVFLFFFSALLFQPQNENWLTSVFWILVFQCWPASEGPSSTASRWKLETRCRSWRNVKVRCTRRHTKSLFSQNERRERRNEVKRNTRCNETICFHLSGAVKTRQITSASHWQNMLRMWWNLSRWFPC